MKLCLLLSLSRRIPLVLRSCTKGSYCSLGKCSGKKGHINLETRKEDLPVYQIGPKKREGKELIGNVALYLLTMNISIYLVLQTIFTSL